MSAIDLDFRVDQPQPFDLVGSMLLLAGMGGGFEGTIQIRVLDDAGQLVRSAILTNTNLTSAWQHQVPLPDPPPTTWGLVLVGPTTGADEHPADLAIPVCFGRAVVDRYRSHFHYVVQPGDSLSSIAATQAPLYAGTGWQPIYEANRHLIADPDLIHPGMVLRLPSDF